METDILIVRDGEQYRILFGHLRLSSVLSESREALINVQGEGPVKIIRTPAGLQVAHDGRQHLPLLQT